MWLLNHTYIFVLISLGELLSAKLLYDNKEKKLILEELSEKLILEKLSEKTDIGN